MPNKRQRSLSPFSQTQSVNETQAGPSGEGGEAVQSFKPSRKKAKRKVQHDHEEDNDDVSGQSSSQLVSSWRKEPGMILSVTLRNFMCHQFFRYEPCQRLNFLSGANGSGKSAVLSAVVFALGGSARTTNRGSANRDFVRSGQHSASVEITMHNKGATEDDAYRPEVYGESVTVVRSVKKDGAGGGYKFLNHRGKVVPIKKPKEELDKMLSTFSIQVDNPIAILNQDNAKTFLADSNPGKLYDFFMRATLLEDCKREYDSASQEKSRAMELLDEKEEHLPDLAKEVEKWSKKMEQVQNRKNREKLIEQKKGELLWALEVKAKAMVDSAVENHSKYMKKVDKCDQEIGKIVEKIKDLKEEEQNVKEEIQEIASKAEEEMAAVNELKNVWRKELTEERPLKQSFECLTKNHNLSVKLVKTLQDRIAQLERDNSAAEYERKERERKEEIDRLKEEVKELLGQMQAQQNHKANLDNNRKQILSDKNELTAQRQNVKNEVDNLERKLRSLNGSQNRKYAVYGEQMEKLVANIRKSESKFSRAPLGPIGAMINLKEGINERQRTAVESELGKLLFTFVVDNFEDRKTLDAMQRQVRAQFSIITSKFASSRYDIEQGRCSHPSFPAIADLLEVKDDTVFNCLVDHKEIDRVLVIPTDREAQDLLSWEENVPANCLYAVTEQENQFFPAPNYRSYHVNSRSKHLLNVDQAELIKAIAKEKEEVVLKLEQFKPLEDDLRERNRVTLEEVSKSERAITTFQNNIKQKNTTIGQLENQSAQEKPVTVGVLEEDLDRERDKMEELEREKKDAEKKFREQEVVVTRAREMYERRKRETEEKQDTDACKAKMDDVANKIKKQEKEKIWYAKKKADIITSMKAVEKDINEKQLQVDQVTEKAKRQMETRPEVIRSVDEINKELKNLQAMAREQERIQEPLAVIMDNLSRHRARYKLAAEETRQLREDVYRLAAMLLQRDEGFRKIRESVSNRVRLAFHVCLQTRKFGGSLSYDHKQRRLFVQVNPEGNSGGDASRGMRTLSGGEKSYSTISLILALWEVMAPPFRFLDEFDVFMDALNRRLAIEQVKHYAMRTRCNQYILLTPLNLQGIDVDDSVRITKLEKSAG